MKLKIIGIVVLSLVMASSLALADTLTFNPLEGAWQNLVAADINQNNSGNPFWANTSDDPGGNRNVGFILTAQNNGAPPQFNYLAWVNNSTGGGAQYLAGAVTTGNAGAPVNNVWVDRTNAGLTSTFLIITIAGNAAGNSFGVYDLASGAATNGNFATGGNGSGPWQQIIAGGSGPGNFGATITYASYGFYFYDALYNNGAGILFVSDPTGSLSSGDSNSNFAFFRNTNAANTFFIGMEDLPYPIGGEGCYGDFNDMIVQVTFPTGVPVPPSALLLGTGLLGLVGFGWRRRNQA